MSQTEAKSSNPSSPTTPQSPTSPDVIDKSATKLCHIVKRPDFDGYGFNLHSEKAKPGQFIGKVDANSPAELAGLKEGDRIIEVNGTPINSETHKQVVQRIKAIACEVRLLLVDVDGKGDGQANANGNSMEISKTEQVLPGASENINSITMVSTKRASQESQRSSSSTLTANGNGLDVTDKAVVMMSHDQQLIYSNNNVPPPPSATMATVPKMNSTNSSNTNATSLSSPGPTPPASATVNTATTNGGSTENGNKGVAAAAAATTTSTTIKAGSLHLPMTAAEMRAKLMSKKKYDPKNESVDLKKKYEIVQKL